MTAVNTNRRKLLGASAALLSIGIAPAKAIGKSPEAAMLPVGFQHVADVTPALFALYREWREAEQATEAAHEAFCTVRKQLVKRYGEAPCGSSIKCHWGTDPAYPELERLMANSNEASGADYDAFMAVMDYPVASLADVGLKVVVLATVWAVTKGEDFHETVTADFMKQASALLARGVTGRA